MVATRVAVLGAGNGGLATAFEWSRQGHEVAIYSHADYSEQIAPIQERGGITSTGVLSGFAEIRLATTDIAEAMSDAEVVLAVGPAYATSSLGTEAGPHLRAGMSVVVCPGSCLGSLAFKRAAGLDLYDESILVGETSTLPFAVRATGPAEIRVFHHFDRGLFAAAAPRSATPRLLEVLRTVWPHAEEASSVFQTALQNGNPVIHPAVTLLNAALIDRTGGDFAFYEEGVTSSTGRLMEAVDAERFAIAEALGITILSEPAIGVLQGYMTEENYTTGYSQGPGVPRDQGAGLPGQPLPDRGRRLLDGVLHRPRPLAAGGHPGDGRRGADRVSRPRPRLLIRSGPHHAGSGAGRAES